VTEKTIADKLAIEPKPKIWLSDAVHLELDGSEDNEEQLVRRAEEIQLEDLHILTLRT
jgi:hypothetical protein